MGRDVFIDANVLLEGNVTLGEGARIGPNVVLRNVTVGAGTVIHPNCVLEQSTVGPDNSIGPFARFRPHSKTGREVHIGNFVELKKTEIADGSKANHLTYLGDSLIGKKVNVGAGTITANYDGANKWQTVIEDGASIGSDNVLVAPIRIGKDATTGAGQHHHAGRARWAAHGRAQQAGDDRGLETAGQETEGVTDSRVFAMPRPAARTAAAAAPTAVRQ